MRNIEHTFKRRGQKEPTTITIELPETILEAIARYTETVVFQCFCDGLVRRLERESKKSKMRKFLRIRLDSLSQEQALVLRDLGLLS
jgi:hypothetical protein